MRKLLFQQLKKTPKSMNLDWVVFPYPKPPTYSPDSLKHLIWIPKSSSLGKFSSFTLYIYN